MSNNVRIKTTLNDNFVNLEIPQKFDFIEVLSLKISEEEAYRNFCSDYGVVVGRVNVNQGFGVPNARVSLFIPVNAIDKDDDNLLEAYPYETVISKNSDSIPYNLLPNSPVGKDDCYTTVGTFPTKREILDNPEIGEVYKKYYKFTTVTNESGDFMLFGVPIGTHFLHVDADMSDAGIISQRPYDLINQGASESDFESNSKFKGRDDDPKLTHVKTVSPISVEVRPFWGDIDKCDIGITRKDVDLKTKVQPTAIFMGSIFTDTEKNSVNKNCRPRKRLGKGDDVIAGNATIGMLRYDKDGNIERYDVDGQEAVDDNGAWAYQIPMNLDHVITSESGELVLSDDDSKGIATRARVRFKMDMNTNGDEGRLRTRANFLVPHNPDNYADSDFKFDNTTKDKHFKNLYWNKIYTVTGFIPRLQTNRSDDSRNFTGIKDVDEGRNNPFPFNNMSSNFDPIYLILCVLLLMIVTLICVFNGVIIPLINLVLQLINFILRVICNVFKSLNSLICEIVGFIDKIASAVWLSSPLGSRCDCRRRGCLGCVRGCGCSCTQPIIPYIPYIRINCPVEPDGIPYAPCGYKTPGFLRATSFRATQIAVATEKSEDPNAGSSMCGVKETPASSNFFHNPDNGKCQTENSLILGNDAGLINCLLYALAEALNVFRFDFYNDWLNGSLFAHLFKYKFKKNRRDKFCDTSRYWSNHYVETCVNDGNGGGSESSNTQGVREGYITSFEDELFYTPYARTTNLRLFSTDIISLGSVLDCDWQGKPMIHQYLTDTTFKKPPFVADLSADGTYVEVSGFDSGCDGNQTLIGDVNCFNVHNNFTQCVNIKRMCQLGIGLDERREDLNGVITAADGFIDQRDVENEFSRGGIVYSNLTNEQINDPSPNNSFKLESGRTLKLVGLDKTYRDYVNKRYNSSPNSEAIWDDTPTNAIAQNEKSFYFYFGINEGKTALSKMNKKYFTPCIPESTIDFVLNYEVKGNGLDENNIPYSQEVTNDVNYKTPNGSITIEPVGGIGPYKYQWEGPTFENAETKTKNDEILKNSENIVEGVYGGVYNVSVIDSVGNVSKVNILVPSLPSVDCEVTYLNVSSKSDDGVIEVLVSNGLAPYKVVLNKVGLVANPSGNTTKTILKTFSQENVTKATFSNLDDGYYEIITTDSSTPKTTCESTVTLTKSTNIVATDLDGKKQNEIANGEKWGGFTDVTCYGNNDGRINILISGGTPPYTYKWKYVKELTFIEGSQVDTENKVYSETLPNETVLTNLKSGYYQLTVTDSTKNGNSTGNVEEFPYYEIVEPPELIITLNDTLNKNVSCLSSPLNNPNNITSSKDGQVAFNVIGGTPPYKYLLNNGVDANNNEITRINQSPGNVTFGGLDSVSEARPYSLVVEDSKGCSVEGPTTLVKKPESPIKIEAAILANDAFIINRPNGLPPIKNRFKKNISLTVTGGYLHTNGIGSTIKQIRIFRWMTPLSEFSRKYPTFIKTRIPFIGEVQQNIKPNRANPLIQQYNDIIDGGSNINDFRLVKDFNLNPSDPNNDLSKILTTNESTIIFDEIDETGNFDDDGDVIRNPLSSIKGSIWYKVEIVERGDKTNANCLVKSYYIQFLPTELSDNKETIIKRNDTSSVLGV